MIRTKSLSIKDRYFGQIISHRVLPLIFLLLGSVYHHAILSLYFHNWEINKKIYKTSFTKTTGFEGSDFPPLEMSPMYSCTLIKVLKINEVG